MSKNTSSTVLIVDDSLFNRKVLEDIILSFGYTPSTAENGKKALEFLSSNKVDLVLLDVMMPEMDGYEVCKIMKKEHTLKEIPVIFITGKDATDDIVKCFEVGGVDYLSKPFNSAELKSRIKTHLDLKKSHSSVVHFNQQLLAVTDNLYEANRTINNKNLELEDSLKKLKDTQIQLIQKEKVAGIGHLAAGAAHEINTPLGFIMSNFETMSKYVTKLKDLISLYENFKNPELDSNAKLIESIIEYETKNHMDYILADSFDLLKDTKIGLERVKEIVSALRAFSNIDQINEFVQYDFNQGVSNALIIAQIELMNYAIIEKEFRSISTIYAVSSEINQVLLNIIMNAVYAIKSKPNIEHGIITIRTFDIDSYVVCDIRDNGIGMDEDTMSKIFEPFYTTKPVEEGAGLGLSFAQDIIINKHHGELKVESKLGEYSKFTILLPK